MSEVAERRPPEVERDDLRQEVRALERELASLRSRIAELDSASDD
jgi:hypothetical protein